MTDSRRGSEDEQFDENDLLLQEEYRLADTDLYKVYCANHNCSLEELRRIRTHLEWAKVHVRRMEETLDAMIVAKEQEATSAK